MNPLHYPDIERCKKLTEIGFPKTFLCIDEDGTHRVSEFARQLCLCPSVMEMLDVIPETIGGTYQLMMNKNNVSYDDTTLVDKGYEYKGEFYDTRFPLKADTLPNALADLIFWLVENGYLNFKK